MLAGMMRGRALTIRALLTCSQRAVACEGGGKLTLFAARGRALTFFWVSASLLICSTPCCHQHHCSACQLSAVCARLPLSHLQHSLLPSATPLTMRQ